MCPRRSQPAPSRRQVCLPHTHSPDLSHLSRHKESAQTIEDIVRRKMDHPRTNRLEPLRPSTFTASRLTAYANWARSQPYPPLYMLPDSQSIAAAPSNHLPYSKQHSPDPSDVRAGATTSPSNLKVSSNSPPTCPEAPVNKIRHTRQQFSTSPSIHRLFQYSQQILPIRTLRNLRCQSPQLIRV